MFCPSCGAELKENATFCIKCGAKVGGDMSATSPPASVNTSNARKGNSMKIAKLVIGIISIVLFLIISLQSCFMLLEMAVNLGGSMSLMVMVVAFAMLTAGLIGIAARNSRGGSITAGAFYIVAALAGLADFSSLFIWSIISLAFGSVFIIGSWKMTPGEAEQSKEK